MRVNEFGEIIRDENAVGNEVETPKFAPPTEPIIEKVSANELEDIKKEFAPKKKFEPIQNNIKGLENENENE